MTFKKIKKFKIQNGNLTVFINFLLLFLLIFSSGINHFLIIKINNSLGIESGFSQLAKKTSNTPASSNGIALSGDLVQDAIKIVIGEGAPEKYGAELGISFSQAQQAINVMKQYDPTYGKDLKITLTGDNLKRYIDIGIKIACEYCCGAKSIVTQDGKAACGCAHSQAMRGLAAYLIQNHGAEYSNDEILRELARWKGIYFPKQMIQKLTQQLQQGNYTPDTAALVLGLDLPDYGQGGGEVPLPSEIKDLPGMVGGC